MTRIIQIKQNTYTLTQLMPNLWNVKRDGERLVRDFSPQPGAFDSSFDKFLKRYHHWH